MMIDEAASTEAPEKCTLLRAQNVGRKRKFLSNQMAVDLCIAGNVIKNTNQRDFKKKSALSFHEFFFLKIFFSSFFTIFFLWNKSLILDDGSWFEHG